MDFQGNAVQYSTEHFSQAPHFEVHASHFSQPFPSPKQIFTRNLTMFRKKLHQKRTYHSSNHQQKGNQVRDYARFFDIRLVLA